MAIDARPTARSIVVCERITLDAANPNRVSPINVINSIRPTGNAPYPVTQGQLSVFAQLTESRGTGRVMIEIRREETDAVVFRTHSRQGKFPNHPLVVYGFRFRILGCVFPTAGLYWVQLWYNGEMLGQLPLVLRSESSNPDEGE
jgi:hypothetical protein